jgi:hypothetical protein
MFDIIFPTPPGKPECSSGKPSSTRGVCGCRRTDASSGSRSRSSGLEGNEFSVLDRRLACGKRR